MCPESIESMLHDLEHSEREYAMAYLRFREHESLPGKPLSVDDARANAVVDLIKRGIPLPETMRFRLHSALGIVNAVESP